MKIYFHLNEGGFSNCYLVVDEVSNQAIIIDPGKITKEIIARIEDNHLNLAAVLITHNHGSHADGLRTLRKIYSPKVFAADWAVAANDTTVITGDGTTEIEGIQVSYLTIPGQLFMELEAFFLLATYYFPVKLEKRIQVIQNIFYVQILNTRFFRSLKALF